MLRRVSESSLSTLVSNRVIDYFLQDTNLVLELEEDGVRIALTIVDTPGFGDNIDNEFALVLLSLYFILLLTAGLAFRKLLVISNVNTMISWRKNLVSSVIRDSETTGYMLCSTLSRQPDIRELSNSVSVEFTKV